MVETVACLREVEAIRATHLPRLKMIFTVSAVQLQATLRPISVVTANSASKAVIRAALDAFLRALPGDPGRTLFYFPSYELVTEIEPPSTPEQVVAVFARTYTSLATAMEPVAVASGKVRTAQIVAQLRPAGSGAC